MARMTKAAIKAALLEGKEVVTRNEHCKAFGGAHRYWVENGEVHGYGCGPNWSDQDSILNHAGDIDRHVDTIYRNGNATIFYH